MTRFLAHFLIILAGWTVTIKYAFPVAFALGEGAAIASHIQWDFWWVVHLWLAWSLLHWQRYTHLLAAGVSIAEIIIITVKFVLFLASPTWNMWTTNWFINKVFVLLCFCLLLAFLFVNRRHYSWRDWAGRRRQSVADRSLSGRPSDDAIAGQRQT